MSQIYYCVVGMWTLELSYWLPPFPISHKSRLFPFRKKIQTHSDKECLWKFDNALFVHQSPVDGCSLKGGGAQCVCAWLERNERGGENEGGRKRGNEYACKSSCFEWKQVWEGEMRRRRRGVWSTAMWSNFVISCFNRNKNQESSQMQINKLYSC